MEELAEGAPAVERHVTLSSVFGHDAFLKEVGDVPDVIRSTLPTSDTEYRGIRRAPPYDVALAVVVHNAIRGAAGACLANAEPCVARGLVGAPVD